RLAGEYAGSHVGTLRRRFFNRPGMLYETPQALIVQMARFQGQEALLPVIDEFNAARHRLPWLRNRQVVVSLTPQSQHQYNGPYPLMVNANTLKTRLVLAQTIRRRSRSSIPRPGCDRACRGGIVLACRLRSVRGSVAPTRLSSSARSWPW